MNKTISLLIFSLLFFQLSIGQKTNDYTKPIKNHSHMLVKGTNIYLIPPTNYVESSNFKGFQNINDKNSMLTILEIPAPFKEAIKGFSAEKLVERNMKLQYKKEILINNYDGLIVALEQEANGLTYSKYMLIYGNETFTAIINGIALKEEKNTIDLLKKSINTIIINDNTSVNPKETLSFTLDESAGNLVLITIIGNQILLHRDKKILKSVNRIRLIVGEFFVKDSIKNKKIFCISKIEKLPDNYKLIPNKGIKEIEIDKVKGFELYAENLENKNEILYQVILFPKDDGYFIFTGVYEKNNEKAISDIKKVIMTFKRK